MDGLRRYSSIPEIPQDPYDISVAQAKELLKYDGALMLSSEQQKTYDAAMRMTDDKAPCCCQCWRWYMTRGREVPHHQPLDDRRGRGFDRRPSERVW